MIDYLRGYPAAVRFVDSAGVRATISVVTVAELYAGVRGPEVRALKKLLKTFAMFPVTVPIAVQGGKLRRQYLKSHQLETSDTLIAATAQEHRLEMVTMNAKHFPMMPVTTPYVR